MSNCFVIFWFSLALQKHNLYNSVQPLLKPTTLSKQTVLRLLCSVLASLQRHLKVWFIYLHPKQIVSHLIAAMKMNLSL